MPFEKGHKPVTTRKKKKKNGLTSFQKLVEKKYSIDRDEQIEKRLNQIPESHRAKYEKAAARKSMRAAVNSQCLECVGYLTKEVSMCTDLACPLYLYRPYQKRSKTDEIAVGEEHDAAENTI